MYTSLSIAACDNHASDGYQIEKLPQGLRKANACGGRKRWLVAAMAQVKLPSSEAGNLSREGGNPLA